MTKFKKPRGETFNAWSDWFEGQTGDKIKPSKDEHVRFSTEHGFLSVIPDFDEKILFCHYAAGDGKFWLQEAKRLCRCLGFKKIHFYTKHNPRAVERMTGAHVRGYLMEVILP